MTVTYQQMALAALKWGGKPLSTNNVHSLVIWACSENSYENTGTKAKWNPWDTTEGEPGSTEFNSAGVKDYPTIQEGLKAFWDTLNNGFYPHIVEALEASSVPALTCQLVCDSPWGSNPDSELQGIV